MTRWRKIIDSGKLSGFRKKSSKRRAAINRKKPVKQDDSLGPSTTFEAGFPNAVEFVEGMPKYTDIWDVTPETAHPRAKQLLGKSIIWDYGDEDSPVGNDTAADTFAAYLSFRAA